MSAQPAARELLDLTYKFSTVKAVVLGDPMFDVYHFGRVDRLSPEAPVPVFVPETRETRYGGAANVVHQLKALGCQVATIFPPAKEWTAKHRYMVGRHQMFRIDKDRVPSEESEVCFTLQAIASSDVLVVSDYAKGWCTVEHCMRAIDEARKWGKPVVVDPKGDDWLKYACATLICPNEKEWTQRANKYTPPKPAILIKRGEHGLRLFTRSSSAPLIAEIDYPAKARHVYDVTGAGDTVSALMAAVLGAGGRMDMGAMLANLAAGHVVGEIGTSVCPIEKLRELLK